MNSDNSNYACLMRMAKNELGAFFTVVADSYGLEQAEISARDWLDEFESVDPTTELTSRNLRLVTITAARRLANRQTALRNSANHVVCNTSERGLCQ